MIPRTLLLLALLPGLAGRGELAARPAAELVRQLGSASHREREVAHAALARRGGAVADALALGLHSGDAEVRRRCLDLLRKLDDAALRAMVLAPQPIRLRFDKVRLASAMLEIEQRTGLNIPVPPEVVNRLVSVDTGTVSFWQAWEPLREAAGLRERTMTFEKPGQQPAQLWVADGKAEAPVCTAGPLRVRVLRTWRESPYLRSAEQHYGGPVAGLLEIQALPHLDLLAVDSIRISRARDHAGKQLTLGRPADQRVPGPPPLLVDGAGRPVAGNAAWLVPLWLPGLKPLYPPRSMAGVIDVRFLVRRPCATIAAPRQAIGKTVTGVRGAALTVTDVATEDGTTTFTVRLDHLDALIAAGPGEHLQRVRVGLIIARDPLAALLEGLELHDARGQPLPRVDFERLDDPGPGIRCRVSFTGAPADGKGTRLVLMARQVVQLGVEFAMGQ